MLPRYRKSLGLFRNPDVKKEILSLDPVSEHSRIVHLMTGYEFPWDIVRALELALMRTFCSPSVSALLHRTGEFRRHGQKRYDDTALLVAEFMHHGYESGRGSMAISHINRIHGQYEISNEDFLFVLSTFIFLPIRWIDEYGWRKTTEQERQALYYFFRAVGERMHIEDIPDSLQAYSVWEGVYEAERFKPSDTNTFVADATVNIVKGWMPGFARPFVKPVMKCLLDQQMLVALGYAQPSQLLRAMVTGAMKLRAFGLRKVTFMGYPSFVTTEPNRTYRQGYEIEKLGPEPVVGRWQ